MQRSKAILLSYFVFFSLSCQALSLVNVLQPGSLLYKDDFSTHTGGWQLVNLPQGNAGYAEDRFRMRVETPTTHIWSTPGLHAKDVRVEALALKTAGPDDNLYGLICRFQEKKGFYAFLISSDGYYGVAKYQGGTPSLFGNPMMMPGDLIQQGVAVNHLSAECNGSHLIFNINHQKAAEFQDAEYTTGEFGLIVGSLKTPGIEIVFDEFRVYRP